MVKEIDRYGPYAGHSFLIEIMYLYHFASLSFPPVERARVRVCVQAFRVMLCSTKNANDERQNIRTWDYSRQ